MVADPKRGEDPDQRDEHACRAERRVACECGCRAHVERKEDGLRGDC